MEGNNINVEELRTLFNSIIDHLKNDLSIEAVAIQAEHDFYWEIEAPDRYKIASSPPVVTVGRLVDDLDFLRAMLAEGSTPPSIMLDHLGSIAKYIAFKIGQ